jgi:hypothetical protein
MFVLKRGTLHDMYVGCEDIHYSRVPLGSENTIKTNAWKIQKKKCFSLDGDF